MIPPLKVSWRHLTLRGFLIRRDSLEPSLKLETIHQLPSTKPSVNSVLRCTLDCARVRPFFNKRMSSTTLIGEAFPCGRVCNRPQSAHTCMVNENRIPHYFAKGSARSFDEDGMHLSATCTNWPWRTGN